MYLIGIATVARIFEVMAMDGSTNIYLCPYCNSSEEYSAPSEVLLMNHVRLVHSNDPDFSIQCSFPGCSRTFGNFRTYQNHILVHPRPVYLRREDESPTTSDSNHSTDYCDSSQSIIMAEEPDRELEGNTSSDLHETGTTVCTITENMQLFAAKWILKTRETRNLTKKAMQGIIEDTSDMVAFATSTLKQRICAELSSQGVGSGVITSLESIFEDPVVKPFDGISSFYQQIQYCRHHFNLVVRHIRS